MFSGRTATPTSASRHYLEWRRHSSMCEVAYRQWASAGSTRDSTIAFAAYTAALDREENAAAQYATAVSATNQHSRRSP